MFQKMLEKFENNRLASVTKNALSLASPFLIVGAFALILRDFPNEGYQSFISDALNGFFFTMFNALYQFTLGSLSLILSVTIGIAYRNQVDRTRTGVYLLVSLTSYLIFVYDGLGKGVLSNHFSPLYCTVSIIVSFLACSILHLFIDRMTQRLEPFSVLGDNNFSISVHTIKPIAILLLIMLFIRGLLYLSFGGYTLPEVIQIYINSAFFDAKPTFENGLFYVFISQVFAFLGMSGTEPLDGIYASLNQAIETNQYYIGLHEPTMATEIYSATFIRTFCMIGGFGSVFCLMIAFFIVSSDRSYHRLGKAIAIPTLFNIGEPALFGIPVIFNPLLLIPFICVPVIQYLFSCTMISFGFFPVVINEVNPLTPIILSGYYATESIGGSILQIINVSIGTLIYVPFVKYLSVPREHLLDRMIPAMEQAIRDGEEVGRPSELLNGEKEINIAAKNLLSELYDSIRANEIALYYQPQMGNENNIIGAEALFRWKHPKYGFIYPPLAVQLVMEDGFSDQLSYWLISKCCSSLERLNKYGCKNFKLSVNILPQQLEKENFAQTIKEIISKYDFGTCSLALEITEQGALASMPYVEKMVKNLKEMGVDLIMDDFGMGHSSMSSMQNNHFSHVKLDGNLVKDITNNDRSADIIQAICNLANKLDCQIIAEYVETEEQKQRLQELGCEIYQGYLYSKALPFDDFVDFLDDHGCFN